jgi:hypothetical protein
MKKSDVPEHLYILTKMRVIDLCHKSWQPSQATAWFAAFNHFNRFDSLGLQTLMVFSSRTFQHLSWGVAFCFMCIWSTYLTFGTSLFISAFYFAFISDV